MDWGEERMEQLEAMDDVGEMEDEEGDEGEDEDNDEVEDEEDDEVNDEEDDEDGVGLTRGPQDVLLELALDLMHGKCTL